MMTGPGLALFYAGLVRKKNVLGTMMQSFALMAIITVLWGLFSYSFCFGAGNGFIGGTGWRVDVSRKLGAPEQAMCDLLRQQTKLGKLQSKPHGPCDGVIRNQREQIWAQSRYTGRSSILISPLPLSFYHESFDSERPFR